MKLWVGVTDKNWFMSLMTRRADEVNFWQPSGSREFRVLQPGEPFLFKLHSPDNFIVGGGFFVRYSALPVSLAWSAFELNNGVDSQSALRERVRQYRKSSEELDPIIGCNILTAPFFFRREDWIVAPRDWAPNIVSGKSYDTSLEIGKELWTNVQQVLRSGAVRAVDVEPGGIRNNIEGERFGQEYLTRSRLGQGAFRVLVTEAYQRRCAITGEKTLPVLEAAHIQPFADLGPHQVTNGMLLRSDMHKLFDLGYITVTPELRVEVSSKLRQDWSNGRDYYAHHGRELIVMPTDVSQRPSSASLQWHNERVFKS